MQLFKRVLTIFLTLSLIFTSVFYGISFNISAASITTAYIEGTNVNVRKQPSTSSAVIEKVSNTSADVLETVKVGNDTWYKITYHNGTQQITGYIFYDSEYIKIVTYNPDASFEEKLKAFPASYHNALKALHSAYPKWEFLPDPVTTSFTAAVTAQTVNLRKQVQLKSNSISWRAMTPGSYNWSTNTWVDDNGGWTGASKEVIAYYMDPRNFLNNSEIYQFLEQTYNPSFQTEEGLKKIVANTFLAGTYSDPKDTAYGGSYVKVIMAAAQQSKVNPYIIASKIIQEQGTNGNSALISGNYTGASGIYKGYYNFFNWSASGSTQEAVIINGLKKARENTWNTRSKSIIEGAKLLANGYISVGQDTYYYQDFNVHNPNDLWHQYAQAAHDARNKGASLAKTYKDDNSISLSFKIPIFTDMPASPSPKPEQNTKRNNYYFSSITSPGLTPTFNMFTYEYSLYVNGNTTVYVKPVANATYVGPSSFTLKKGVNTVTLEVKAETGFTTKYKISVEAESPCQITISGANAPAVVVKKGDTNGDGNITIRDLANIRLHLLGLSKLAGNNSVGADTNNDGSITIRDLANIRLHLLGISLIK